MNSHQEQAETLPSSRTSRPASPSRRYGDRYGAPSDLSPTPHDSRGSRSPQGHAVARYSSSSRPDQQLGASPSRRSSGGSAHSAGPSSHGPVPTVIAPVQHPSGPQPPQPQHRTTLPPLSSLSTRPSSNSLSAVSTPSIAIDWDSSRPRAASTSSFIVRGMAQGPHYGQPYGHAPPQRRHPDYGYGSYEQQQQQQHQQQQQQQQQQHYQSSVSHRGQDSSLQHGHAGPYGSNLPHPSSSTSWSSHGAGPTASHRAPAGQVAVAPFEGRPRADSSSSSSIPYARNGTERVVPSGATVPSSQGDSRPRSYSNKLGQGSTTTTHMAGTIRANSINAAHKPSLDGFTKEQDGRRYRLVVVQSPSRARMCGFGDKDRRPLSPTLIVKLIITDTRTNQDVAPTDVDTSAFFLAADLVHPEDLKAAPRNLLVHQHAASVATDLLNQSGLSKPSSDRGGLGATAAGFGAVGDGFDGDRGRTRSLSDPWLARQGAWAGGGPGGGGFTPSSAHQQSPHHSYGPQGYGLDPPQAPYTTVTTETYTRNFVGASVASANILKDENDHMGIFFVLQDLSVRTEGVYRIKLMFVNLAGSEGQIKQGVSDALAETYTEPFTVYTPRRFPGVIEPTGLSKKFAAQGVKIPVRVDRKKRRRDSGEDGDGVYGEDEGDSG